MHLDAGQIGQDVGYALQRRPVVLDVLARGEMPIVAIVAARDMGQHAQLARTEQAVGNGDAQHGRMALNIEAVAQPQRAELFLAELPGEKTAGLVAKLRDAFIDQGLIMGIVTVHGCDSCLAIARRRPPAMESLV